MKKSKDIGVNMRHDKKKDFSRKHLFPEAIRVTNEKGERVWKLGDKEYKTKQEMFNSTVEEANKLKEDAKKALTKSE
jgi:hypothetical protein